MPCEPNLVSSAFSYIPSPNCIYVIDNVREECNTGYMGTRLRHECPYNQYCTTTVNIIHFISFCRQVGKETTRTALRKLVLDDKDAFLRIRTQGRATGDSSSDFFLHVVTLERALSSILNARTCNIKR